MNKTEIIEQIRRIRIMPVIRAGDSRKALAIAEAIVKGGINVLEITMTVPNATEVIRNLQQHWGNSALIGAGTILDAQTARHCLDAGAQFIVSPITDRETIALCQNAGIAIFPGAMTINEVYEAWKMGADAVKVFPANVLGGASYVKALKTVLPQIEIIPTGGIGLETVAQFLRAGALAVGVGGELADPAAADKNGIITKRAEDFLSAIKTL